MKRTTIMDAKCAGVALGMLCTVAGLSAYADGFRNPPLSAEGLAVVGGRYTLIDDATASAYNPANLLGVEKNELVLSVTSARSEKKFTDASGQSASVEEEWYLMPDLYTAFRPEGSDMVAGIAITTPYGQATEYDKDTPLRYSSPYRAEMRTINVTPSLAVPIGEQIKVGAGMDIMWSDFELKQVFPWSSVAGNPLVPDGELRFDGDAVGLGGNVGITWQVAKQHRLALVYRSAIDLDYDGDTIASGAPVGLPVAPRSDFSTTIKLPSSVALGYGVNLSDKWSVGVDVEWFEWSRYQDLTLDAGLNAPLLPTATIPQNWDDTWNFGLGSAYELNEAWTLRAGYIFLETPVPASTMSPLLAENDQHVITVGAGYQQGAHRLDVAYGIGIYHDRTVSNNQNPAFNGEYTFDSQLASVSYGYTF